MASFLHEADAVVPKNWTEKCWQPDGGIEAALHLARFHAAPAVLKP